MLLPLPGDRDARADGLHDGTFQARLADEIQRLLPGAALKRAMPDYALLGDQARACAK